MCLESPKRLFKFNRRKIVPFSSVPSKRRFFSALDCYFMSDFSVNNHHVLPITRQKLIVQTCKVNTTNRFNIFATQNWPNSFR